MAQAHIVFPQGIKMRLSLWNGVFTLNIGPIPTFSWERVIKKNNSGWMRLPLCQLFHGMDLFGERVSQSEYFSICVAAAHIMVHKYGSQGYKTFQNCLFMFGIHFRITIWDGLWRQRILAHIMLHWVKKCEKQGCKWLCIYWVKIKNQSIAQTDSIFPKCIWLGLRLWNGVVTLNIGTVPSFSWAGPLLGESPKLSIFLNVWGCSPCHGPPILIQRLQNICMRSFNGCDKFLYNHLGWFMRKKNIGTHNAAIGKEITTNTRLYVVMSILSKK